MLCKCIRFLDKCITLVKSNYYVSENKERDFVFYRRFQRNDAKKTMFCIKGEKGKGCPNGIREIGYLYYPIEFGV